MTHRIRILTVSGQPIILVGAPQVRELFVDQTIERLYGRQPGGEIHLWEVLPDEQPEGNSLEVSESQVPSPAHSRPQTLGLSTARHASPCNFYKSAGIARE